MEEQLSVQEKIISQGNALVKLENSTQMQVAIQRPRDESKILGSALHELDLYPSMAEEAIYNKPVGKDKDDKDKMKYAEGLSIRTAESLANRWNNSAYGGDIVGEDEESATIAAVLLDYETNTRHVIQKRVSKFYKSYQGKVVQYSPDRFDIVVAANMSKALREVILRSLPGGLKKEYENKAKKLLKGDKLDNRRKGIVVRFEGIQITQAQLETYKKKPLKEWKHEDITELLGLFNAIRDGELEAENIFGKKKTEEKTEESKLKFAGRNFKKETSGKPCPNTGDLHTQDWCEKFCATFKGCPAWEPQTNQE